MAGVGQAPGSELMGMDPASLSNEVPDYSHVPPPASNDIFTSPESTQNPNPPETQVGDYGQKGGGDVNMEAPILSEDVIKAGGLGARDELGSPLPSAVDNTDYEESLMGAMEYEDVKAPQEGGIARPGVGFVKSEQQRIDGFQEAPKE
jgi:hypothetical protein